MARILFATAVLSLAWTASPVIASTEFGGQVTVTTDYMFRGVSQTTSGGAVQLEFDLEHDSGLFAHAWASNVDFSEPGLPDDGARVELDVGAGYSVAIGDRIALAAWLSAYRFPGTHAGIDYDYEEWHGLLSLDDWHEIRVSYSGNVFGSGASGTYYAAATGFDFSDAAGMGLRLGHYDLDDAYDASYSYAQLYLAGAVKSVAWKVSYFSTTDEAAVLFSESTVDDRVVLELTLEF
jgi:uncharacterized protein (TIGR02001 family)